GGGAGVGVVVEAGSAGRPRFDMVGVLLVTGGLVAVVYACSRAVAEGWRATVVLTLFGGAAVLTLFVPWESRTAQPLHPLRIVWDRNRGVGRAWPRPRGPSADGDTFRRARDMFPAALCWPSKPYAPIYPTTGRVLGQGRGSPTVKRGPIAGERTCLRAHKQAPGRVRDGVSRVCQLVRPPLLLMIQPRASAAARMGPSYLV